MAKNKIGISQLVDVMNIHKNTILYHLNILIKSKRIIRKGKGKNTFYMVQTK